MNAPEPFKAHANLVEFSRAMTELAGGTVFEVPGCMIFSVPYAPAMLSGAHALAADCDLDRLIELGQERLSGSSWSISVPAQICQDVKATGISGAELSYTGGAPAMWLHGIPRQLAKPRDVEVDSELDSAGWRDFWRVCEDAYQDTEYEGELSAIFDRPDTSGVLSRLYPIVAYNQRMQAVGAALTVDSDDIAGLYWVGVTKSARGLGIGTLCSAAAIHAARERGARGVILQSSPSGLGVYRRLGFETLFWYRYWIHRTK